MNANLVYLGPVLREGVDASLKAAPVILVAPVGNERLGLLEGDALRPVADGFPLRPPRGRQPTFQIVQCRLWHMHLERCDVLGRRRERDARSVLRALLCPDWPRPRRQQTGTSGYGGMYEPTSVQPTLHDFFLSYEVAWFELTPV